MSRQALLIGSSDDNHAAFEQMLAQFAYARLLRAPTLVEAVEKYGRVAIDLLVVPLDEVDDASLSAIDRTVWHNQYLRVIATGPSADPQLMLRAMRSGIQEFLVRPIVDAEGISALERLHRRVDQNEVRGDVYAVYSPKGGVGVSTVAVNLACALTTLHPTARVAIADLLVPGGDASILLDARPKYTISDIARKIERLDDELLNSVMTPTGEGLWLLAGPEGTEDGAVVNTKAVTATVAQLHTAFDFTVLDCEHQLNDRTLAALDASERILLVTELQVLAMRSTQRTLSIFRRLGYPEGKIAVVVNRYHSRDIVSLSEAADVFKEEIFFSLPNDYKTVAQASTSGMPVERKDPTSTVSVAFRQLAQKVSGGSLPSAPANSTAPGQEPRSRFRELFGRKR